MAFYKRSYCPKIQYLKYKITVICGSVVQSIPIANLNVLNCC